MTKEELLQKGISEDIADEIIAGFSDSDEDNSLLALQKALEGEPEMESLFKAEKEDDDDDEEEEEEKEKDYDESYMKKNMKRYMKENGPSCQKMMKEVGLFKEKMEKAVHDIDEEADGAIVEMVELSPILESQLEMNESMVKAISAISAQVDMISKQSDLSYDLMRKASKVTAGIAGELQSTMSQTAGRKGVVSTTNMSKAMAISSDDNKVIYDTLMKAVLDRKEGAGEVMSTFESSGRNIRALKESHRKYIHDLIAQEAN